MKLFQKFFKPKWKNNDPAIRKQALLALDPADNQEILSEIVCHDGSCDLRLLALKRISDFDFMVQTAQSNSQPEVRELANKRIRQSLSGEQATPLDESQRIAKIQQINDQKLFEYIVEKGNTGTLRKSVIEHITREALLGNLAISDNDSDIRHSAAEKISQKSTLERVFRATKTKDKNVSRIVKKRLDHLTAEAEKPAKLLSDQKNICVAIEGLGIKGLWQRDKPQFDACILQWSALGQPESLALQNRFEQAKNKFERGYEDYLERHAERLQEEASYLPIREEKQAIIDRLHQLITQLEKTPDIESPEFSDIKDAAFKQEALWKNIKSLPDDIEIEIRQQFNDLLTNIKQSINQRLHNKTLLDSLDILQKEINKNIKQPFKLSSKLITQFENKLSKLQSNDNDEKIEKLVQNIKQRIDHATNLLTRQKDRMDNLFTQMKTQITEMEDQLSKGILKEAIGLRNTIQNNMIELEKHGVKNLHQFKEHLNESSNKINELSNWRSWANTPQKQQIIDKVEALIGSDLDPKEIAYIVSQARKDWKNLGPSEKDSSQALWEKFQSACDSAYEPCKVFFAEESKTFAENYEGRVKFLEKLEAFLKQADWDNIDWKKVETLFRQARQDWNELGLTDKTKRKDLNKRFYLAHNQLKAALNREWDKNTETKSAIVTKAQALANEENLQSAINTAKELQQQWKAAGRIQHAKERELWGQFKQACDAVFARREELNKQRDEEAQKNIDHKEALVSKIENICNQPLDRLDALKSELKQCQNEIINAGNTTSETDSAFDKRLSFALNIYERKQESLEKYNIVAELIYLREKSAACTQLELAIEKNETDNIETIVESMSRMQEPKQQDWNEKIQRRFQSAEQLAKTNDSSNILSKKAEKNLILKKLATVQLEIIADIETPDVAANDRLKAQAQRLSDKLNKGYEQDAWDAFLEMEVEWLTNGPVLSVDLASLKQRHDSAIRALKEMYPEALKDYST